MRLVIQARMVSIEGKFLEHRKVVEVMEKLSNKMFNETGLVDDSTEDEDSTDVSFTYDQNEFTVEQVKKLYNECKNS